MSVYISSFAGSGAQFFDNNGIPLAGGKIYSYSAGTTTPRSTFTTSAGNIQHSNPIILDASGRISGGGEIWLTEAQRYKFTLTTSADVQIATYDEIPSIDDSQVTAAEVSFVGFDGQVGTVEDLADDDGSDWIGFLPSGTGAVARSAQDKMREIVTVTDFGAVGNGVADDTTKIQAAIDAGIATGNPFVLNFPVGEFLVSDELDFSAATESFSIIGAGRQKTIILGTAFGTSKKLFKGADVSNPIYIELRDFSIRGVNDTRAKAHPIGIYFPNASRVMFSGISSAAWGNTVIQIGPGFNSDINNLELFTSGWQPLYKEVASNVTVSTTSGSANITASASIFDPADVGQTIYIRQITSGTGNPSNSAIAATISAYTSATQVTLDRNCFVTSAARSISFDSVKGTINAADKTLTFNASCLTSDDVGRIISIQGAGSGTGGMLTTKIDSVTSATECELVDAAATSVTNNYVWFSPSIYVGAEIAGAGATPINDLTLSDVHMEQYRGPAVLFDEGTAIHLTRFKAHGRSWSDSNNFADSRQAIILNDNSRVTVSQYQIEFGCFGLTSGPVLATGGVSVSLDQGTIAATAHGGYIFEFVTASEQAILNVGAITCNAVDWTKMAGFANLTGATASRNFVSSGAAPTSIGYTEQRSAIIPPMVASQFRSMTPVSVSDDTAISLPSFREQGFVLLSTDATTTNGIFWYRVDSVPNLQQVYAGADLNNTTGPLTGTTGTNGKTTISAANDGKIYVENRMGATRVITLTFLGG
jgi:hypothetical protein